MVACSVWPEIGEVMCHSGLPEEVVLVEAGSACGGLYHAGVPGRAAGTKTLGVVVLLVTAPLVPCLIGLEGRHFLSVGDVSLVLTLGFGAAVPPFHHQSSE